jgi:hypothetical protein
MATARPFAYNIGAPIAGTEQVGGLAVGTPTSGFSETGLEWWNGPDEDLGYVIAQSVPSDTQPTPVSGVLASVGFFRSSALTDPSFISIANAVAGPSGGGPFASGSAAKTWLNANGYWTSYVGSTGSTGATGDFNVTITEVGSNVVWSGSGKFNLTALTPTGTDTMVGGFSASSGIWAIGPSTTVDTYSGVTTFPASIGSGGRGVTSNLGSTFGILSGTGSGRSLYVPSGYVSNTTISGTSTYNNTTISGMGLSVGTYTWAWGSGANASSLVMVIGGTGSTGATGATGGAGSWYFYYSEGATPPPPTSDGNALFVLQSPPNTGTYNPNKSDGAYQIYFNLTDSAGTDYTAQFTALAANGGTLTMTQGSNVARYTSVIPGTFFVESSGGFFIMQTGPATQTLSSASPFVSGSPITLTFS